jgi:hypothetical protein
MRQASDDGRRTTDHRPPTTAYLYGSPSVDDDRSTTDYRRPTTDHRISIRQPFYGRRLLIIGGKRYAKEGTAGDYTPDSVVCRHLSPRQARAAPSLAGITRLTVAAAMRASAVVFA